MIMKKNLNPLYEFTWNPIKVYRNDIGLDRIDNQFNNNVFDLKHTYRRSLRNLHHDWDNYAKNEYNRIRKIPVEDRNYYEHDVMNRSATIGLGRQYFLDKDNHTKQDKDFINKDAELEKKHIRDQEAEFKRYNDEYRNYRNYIRGGAIAGGLLGSGLGATASNIITSKIIKKKDLKQLKNIVLKSNSSKEVIDKCKQTGLDKVLPKYISYIGSLSKDPDWKTKVTKKINIKLSLPIVGGALGGVAGGYLGHQGGAYAGGKYYETTSPYLNT